MRWIMDRREILKGAGSLTAVLTGIGGASSAAAQAQQARVRILRTNEPVHGDQWLNVHARITNVGFGVLDGEAKLIVGNNPTQVDSQSVTLSPNESRIVTLGYRTYPVQTTDTFPVEVECVDGFDQRIVQVDPVP